MKILANLDRRVWRGALFNILVSTMPTLAFRFLGFETYALVYSLNCVFPFLIKC